MKSLTAIMKPVGTACNLACVYCYNRRLRGENIEKITLMSPIVLEASIQGFLEAGESKAKFIWHGGEPLLAGIEFYREAVTLQEKYRLPDQKVVNSIQTNGILLTSEWVDFLTEAGFRIGVSLDGPQEMHDRYRVDRQGKGTFTRVLKAISLLQARNVKFGLGAVITKVSARYPKRIYQFFHQLGVNNFDFSPCAEKQVSGEGLEVYSVSPGGYTQFLVTLFDEWFTEDNPAIKIRCLQDLIQVVIGGSPRLCSFGRTCAKYLAVDANGDVYICGRFMGVKEMFIGNLVETPLRCLLTSAKYQELRQLLSTPRQKCLSCRWEPVCKGECPYYCYSTTGKLQAQNYFCSTNKQVFAHVDRVVRREMQTSAQKRQD